MGVFTERGKLAILGSRGIPAQYGGFETFTEEIAIRLVERGVDVAVYCEGTKGEKPSNYKGVRLFYIPAPDLGPLTTILFDLRCLWHARNGHDVVYMLGYGAGLFCFLPRLWGRTVWVNMDGIEWKRSKWSALARIWFRLMEAAAIRTASRVVADARGIERHLRDRHGRMRPCTVIPYGSYVIGDADQDLLKEYGVSPRRYHLVVCRLEPENHVLEMVRGFTVSRSQYPLVIVGEHRNGGPYVARLLKYEGERIRFAGPIYDREKLLSLRYHACAYFHGHSVGGTNPSLLESMGCGTPVVAHDNTFNREVAGEAGRFFGSPEELAEILVEVESLGPEERETAGRSFTKRIQERYDWDSITGQYLELLNTSGSGG